MGMMFLPTLLTPPTPKKRTWNSKMMENDVFVQNSVTLKVVLFWLKGLAVSIERMGIDHHQASCQKYTPAGKVAKHFLACNHR